MTLNNQEYDAIQRVLDCMQLYELHRKQRYGYASLGRTLIQRKIMRLVSLSRSLGLSLRTSSHTPLELSSKNTYPTSDSRHQVMVICHRGRDKAVFSGTPYRVANQVNLFLTIGMNGDTLREKSSTDLMKTVASSSYFSALSRHRSGIKSTVHATESYVRATHPHEEYAAARHHLPVPEFIRKSTET